MWNNADMLLRKFRGSGALILSLFFIFSLLSSLFLARCCMSEGGYGSLAAAAVAGSALLVTFEPQGSPL
jgi:hypothetical protein